MEKQPKPYKKLRIAFLCLCIAFVVLSTSGVIGFFSLFRAYDGKIPVISGEWKRTDINALPTPNAELFDAALSKGVDYYETGEIKEVPIYEQNKIDRFIISMVIVVQNGSITAEERQTDMIFIASFNQLLQQFTIVSVARDTIVPFGDEGWKRINAAYARGGAGQLINTINDLFGLDIQNYVLTGTDELAVLADDVKGIPATLSEGEAAYLSETLNTPVSAGKQQLSGAQAVALLLDRTSDDKGDLGRAERQLDIVLDTFEYLQDSFDSSFLYPFCRTVFKNVRTNLDFETLRGVAYEMTVSDDLSFRKVRLPFDDSYTELNLDGAYALLPEFEKNRILLQQALYGKEIAE